MPSWLDKIGQLGRVGQMWLIWQIGQRLERHPTEWRFFLNSNYNIMSTLSNTGFLGPIPRKWNALTTQHNAIIFAFLWCAIFGAPTSCQSTLQMKKGLERRLLVIWQEHVILLKEKSSDRWEKQIVVPAWKNNTKAGNLNCHKSSPPTYSGKTIYWGEKKMFYEMQTETQKIKRQCKETYRIILAPLF